MPIPPVSPPEVYPKLVFDHLALQEQLKVVSTRLREFTLAQQHARQAEVALLDSIADTFRLGVGNDLQRSGQDVSNLHDELKTNPRAKHLLRSFTPTPLGAGADSCSYADFSQNLVDGLANSVTAEIRDYKREIDSLGGLVQGYTHCKQRYDHYVAKLTTLSAKAASSEDGVETAKISAKLTRNMEKLKVATLGEIRRGAKNERSEGREKHSDDRVLHSSKLTDFCSSLRSSPSLIVENDCALVQACGELTAATSLRGIGGRLDPIIDRLVQDMGLDAGCRLGYVVQHQNLYGKTKGTLGGQDEDSESDTDSDTEDEAYKAGEDDEGWYDDDEEGAQPKDARERLEALGKRNFLQLYKPRHKSLTRYMPREKPKHYEGFLLVRQEKKLLSSRCFCVLRGNLLCVYGNANEPLFGIPAIYDIKVKNVTEWESKAPHGLIVEDGYQENKKVFLRYDEDAGGWLKALLRASCWDDGRSRMNILGTLKKIKDLTAGDKSRSGSAADGGSSAKQNTALRMRSSTPHLFTKDATKTATKKKKKEGRTRTMSGGGFASPAATGAGAGVRRRPSTYANPFAAPAEAAGNSPVMFGKRHRRGMEPPVQKTEAAAAPEAPTSSSNPFGDSSDEEIDVDLPPPPSLNPLRSSGGRVEEEEEANVDDSQSTDDFLTLSVGGKISYKAFLGWDEIQTALTNGEITEDEVSVLWLEVAGGEFVDQDQFSILVRKLERALS